MSENTWCLRVIFKNLKITDNHVANFVVKGMKCPKIKGFYHLQKFWPKVVSECPDSNYWKLFESRSRIDGSDSHVRQKRFSFPKIWSQNLCHRCKGAKIGSVTTIREQEKVPAVAGIFCLRVLRSKWSRMFLLGLKEIRGLWVKIPDVSGSFLRIWKLRIITSLTL